LGEHALHGRAETLLIGIVQVSQSGYASVANEFGKIEACRSRIRLRNQNARGRVENAFFDNLETLYDYDKETGSRIVFKKLFNSMK